MHRLFDSSTKAARDEKNVPSRQEKTSHTISILIFAEKKMNRNNKEVKRVAKKKYFASMIAANISINFWAEKIILFLLFHIFPNLFSLRFASQSRQLVEVFN